MSRDLVRVGAFVQGAGPGPGLVPGGGEPGVAGQRPGAGFQWLGHSP